MNTMIMKKRINFLFFFFVSTHQEVYTLFNTANSYRLLMNHYIKSYRVIKYIISRIQYTRIRNDLYRKYSDLDSILSLEDMKDFMIYFRKIFPSSNIYDFNNIIVKIEIKDKIPSENDYIVFLDRNHDYSITITIYDDRYNINYMDNINSEGCNIYSNTKWSKTNLIKVLLKIKFIMYSLFIYLEEGIEFDYPILLHERLSDQ